MTHTIQRDDKLFFCGTEPGTKTIKLSYDISKARKYSASRAYKVLSILKKRSSHNYSIFSLK